MEVHRQQFQDTAVLRYRDAGRTVEVRVDEIRWIEGAGNYIQIHTPRRVHLVRFTLKATLELLDPQRFVRVRPSAIVAVQHVCAVTRRPGGNFDIALDDGTTVRSSRTSRERIDEVLASWVGCTIAKDPSNTVSGGKDRGCDAVPPREVYAAM